MVKKCRHVKVGLDPRLCECAWYADLYVDGQRAYTNLGNDYRVAEARHARMVADKLDGQLRRESVRDARRGSGFGALAEEWLKAKEAEGMRVNTLRAYRNHVNRLTDFFGTVPVESVGIEDVTEFLATVQEHQSGNYARQLWVTFRAILGYAEEQGLIDTVPMKTKRVRFRKTEKVPFTLSEIEKALASITDPVIHSLAEFIFLTGLRVGEALALTPDDVNGANVTVRKTLLRDGSVGLPKTERSIRTVALSPRAAEVLRHRPQDGRRFWPITYNHAFHALKVTVSGRKVTWHTFRHANAALRAQASQDMRTQRDQLGHSNFQRTIAYGWSPQEDATALDDVRSSSSQAR